jgi:hypothetical protein
MITITGTEKGWNSDGHCFEGECTLCFLSMFEVENASPQVSQILEAFKSLSADNFGWAERT